MIIRNARVVDVFSEDIILADVYIEGDKISKIVKLCHDYVPNDNEIDNLPVRDGEQPKEIDAKGKYMMPGFIDLHVHLRDPGLTYKEDILTGAAAAAKGGVTTVLAMPNTKPVVDNVETLQYVLDKDKEAPIHVRQISAITKGMDGKELVDMDAMINAGAIGFSEDGKSVMDINVYNEAMKKAAAMGAVVFAHCEDKPLVGNGVLNMGVASEKYAVPGIQNAVEDSITARDIFLANDAGTKLHICHASTKGVVLLMELAAKLGANVTAEACPHHFTLTDADITEADANYKMNPPLRTEEDVRYIIKALQENTIQCISTDHAPHSEEEKANYFDKAPFGIIGLETSAALTYTALVSTGLLSLNEMARKMSYNPAGVLSINDKYGAIKEGYQADLCLFDAKEEWIVTKEDTISKAKNTPYLGETLKGRVKLTICDGKVAFSELD